MLAPGYVANRLTRVIQSSTPLLEGANATTCSCFNGSEFLNADHGRPDEHENPHEHPINDTPATPGQVGKSRPLAPTEPARLTEEAKAEKPDKKVP